MKDKQIKPRRDRSTENTKNIVDRIDQSSATTEQKTMTTEASKKYLSQWYLRNITLLY